MCRFIFEILHLFPVCIFIFEILILLPGVYIYFWNLESFSSVYTYFWNLNSASRGVYLFLKSWICFQGCIFIFEILILLPGVYIYFWNLESSSSVSVYFWKLESASRGVYPFLKARIKSNNLPFWSVYLFWNLNWQRYQLQRPAGQRLVTNTTFRPLKFESWRIILSLKDITWIWTLAAAPPHPKDCLAIYSFYSLRPHLKNALCHQKVKHFPESIISSIFTNFVSLIPVLKTEQLLICVAGSYLFNPQKIETQKSWRSLK